MNETPYSIAHGRPPEPAQLRNRQAGPAECLIAAFDAALNDALNADMKALLESRPTRVIEAFARALVVDALDGRASAQRLVLARLDRTGADASAEEEGADTGDYSLAIRSAFAQAPAPASEASAFAHGATADETADEVRDEDEDEERFVYDDETTRQRLGDRYGEFKARFERAVNASDLDALAELAEDFDDAKLP